MSYVPKHREWKICADHRYANLTILVSIVMHRMRDRNYPSRDEIKRWPIDDEKLMLMVRDYRQYCLSARFSESKSNITISSVFFSIESNLFFLVDYSKPIDVIILSIIFHYLSNRFSFPFLLLFFFFFNRVRFYSRKKIHYY